MRGIKLFIGGVAVGLIVQLAIAQSENRGIVQLITLASVCRIWMRPWPTTRKHSGFPRLSA